MSPSRERIGARVGAITSAVAANDDPYGSRRPARCKLAHPVVEQDAQVFLVPFERSIHKKRRE